ncbi:MAG TPA: hypothetical protein VHF26_05865, partial [Trebonia sp.]|nr:hypothetical protein [Trebonia sp.]
MRRKRLLGIGRWPALAVMTAASALMLTGLAQASTAPGSVAGGTPGASPSASASPAPSAPVGSPNAGTSTSKTASGKPKTTCSVTSTGRLSDCQRPVAKSALPSGAKNSATVNQPVSDLASIVDART